MSVATQPMTLEDYLNFTDGTDNRYELVEGTLIAMPPESDLNNRIASFLYACFLKLGIPSAQLSMKAQVAVSGRLATARQPDLMVLSEEAAAALRGAKQRLINYDMPPPALVVEVVSPNQENRDYRHKRTEYASCHIPEYWIVDPQAEKVTILEWVDGIYEERIYQGEQTIVSPRFPQANLTAAQVLVAG